MTTVGTAEATAMKEVLQRLAGELAGLSDITGRIQDATLHLAVSSDTRHIETLQELDALHQHMNQLSAFIAALSATVPDAWCVGIDEAAAQINIAQLSLRLRGHATGPAAASTGDGQDEPEFFLPVDEPLQQAPGEPDRNANVCRAYFATAGA